MTLEKYTICHLVSSSIEKFGDKMALGYIGEKAMTYKDLGSNIQFTAEVLDILEVEKNDKVAILGENSPNWGVSYLSILFKGAIVVPILPEFHENEIMTILEHSGSNVVFVSDKQYARMGKLIEAKNYKVILLDKLEFKSPNTHTKSKSKVWYPLSEGLVSETDLAAIIYTSGTTGSSKGVMLTHKNLSWQVNTVLTVQPVCEKDRFVSILPMSHTFENSLGFLLPLHTGASVYYIRKQPPAPSVLLEAFKQVKPTILLTVPMIIEKIYRKQVLPKFNKSFITRNMFKFKPTRVLLNRLAGKKLAVVFGGELKFFGIGGSKLDGQIERYLREAKFPYAIGYGLTETAPMLSGTAPADSIYQGTGPAMKGIHIKLINVNEETGEGEIVATGPNVMQGYYKNEDATKAVFTEDGYFRTGDLGYIDKNGVVYIRGRIKNMILGTNGENIYPEEIESLINGIPGIEESLVIHLQGKIVAMVNINLEELENKMLQLNEKVVEISHETMDEVLVEIQQFVNQRVNKFSRLNKVVFHALPFEKTPTKKIKRYLYGG
ncbi:MAG: AMP-binding protein [Bacteroidales bacterium]|nr:AMP-binding protein [Bacteroidales bacterium]MCF8391054.1 AMP-binding protein [Bacteroidales bacterium]